MRFYDLIDKKKKGEELTEDEILFWVNGSVSRLIPDYQISALLMAIAIKGMTEYETICLTKAMANSGQIMDLREFADKTIDKHSTGGVGDSVTFTLLPVLAADGYICAKVSGRGLGYTGGTLDKLESIKGVKIDMSFEKFKNQLKNINIAICGQNPKFCPADKIFYALRDVTATIDSIPLIASSVMSKKLCCGAKNILLDVKYGNGAFMKTKEKALELARLMVKIGTQCNRNTKAVITEMNSPLDDWIGNKVEIYGAIEVLNGKKNKLYNVSKILYKTITSNDTKFDELINTKKPLEILYALLKAQGSQEDVISPYNTKFKANIIANKSGYIKEITAIEIAKVISKIGGGREKKEDKINLNVGIRLIKREGEHVMIGDVLAELLYDNEEEINYIKDIEKAYKIFDNKIIVENPIYKEI